MPVVYDIEGLNMKRFMRFLPRLIRKRPQNTPEDLALGWLVFNKGMTIEEAHHSRSVATKQQIRMWAKQQQQALGLFGRLLRNACDEDAEICPQKDEGGYLCNDTCARVHT